MSASGSDADDPTQIANLAVARIEQYGWVGFIRNFGIGGIFAAVILETIDLITGFGTSITSPIFAFVDGIVAWVEASFLAPVRVIDAGAGASASSFGSGLAAWLGPFAFPVAMLSAIAGLYIFLWFWRRVDLSPLGWLSSRFS